PIRTTLGSAETAEPDDELAERPSTAEQAVPWLIGVILLLAGMVIVLLALIFAGDASLGGAAAATPTVAAVIDPASESQTPAPTPTPVASAAPSVAAATSSAPAVPQYGPLEMVYQGRSAAGEPIYLLHRDFTIDEEPEVLAQDASLDIRGIAWAPDGTVGAGLYADLLISIEAGEEKRNLGDGIVSVTFGPDASTLYAVRLTEDGANDVATVLQIDYVSGDTTDIATVTYPRPTVEAEDVVREAQFADEGGPVRIYWVHGGSLWLWALGAGSWQIDPADGAVTEQDGDQPVHWSPGGVSRITRTFGDGITGIRLHQGDEEEPSAQTTVEGFVSHVRWSPDGERIVFTVGRASGGGVLQDLFLWDLQDGVAPMQITSTGAAFGAEWLGTAPRWEAD
ncbi:MAG: hypothetical protein M3Y29_05980, partial [Chloroflexota bacterium]|nr:hypothetical protein [Chloroflexota bacterium]